MVINITSLLGLGALLGTVYINKKLGWYWLYVFGIINVILIAANRVIYETGILWKYLPIVQKFTFISVLMWIWILALRSKQLPTALPEGWVKGINPRQ